MCFMLKLFFNWGDRRTEFTQKDKIVFYVNTKNGMFDQEILGDNCHLKYPRG